jgi:hypothetical protein
MADISYLLLLFRQALLLLYSGGFRVELKVEIDRTVSTEHKPIGT